MINNNLTYYSYNIIYIYILHEAHSSSYRNGVQEFYHHNLPASDYLWTLDHQRLSLFSPLFQD